MRIAYVCVDPGIPVFGTKGASVHVQEIIRAFRSMGHDVHLYCTRLGDDRPADLTDLEVTHVPVGKGEGRDERARAAQREQLVEAAARTIADRIVVDGADAVYERCSLFSVVLAMVTSRLGIPGYLEVNAPLVEEQRDHRILVDEGAAWAHLRAQLRAATRVATVSADVAAWCSRHGDATLPDRLVVAPNGVNVERIQPVTPSPDHIVLFVGTLKPWHGTEHLIRAAALAQQPWRLRVVGDGPQGPALRQLAQEQGLDVEFTGAVAPSEIPEAMAGAAVAVAPYPEQEDQYFSPLKVYEYAAAGLPVVASRVGQIPEIITDGETGLLVPPSDPAALAAAIDALVAEPERARAMGAAARASMEEEHTWQAVLDRIMGGTLAEAH